MATIKDIADKVGVSPATVSRILNHDDSISFSADTKLKVFQTVEELEYVTVKERKRKKAQQKKYSIGFAEWVTESGMLNDPYYLYLQDMLEQESRQLNIHMFQLKRQEDTFINPSNDRLDGIIVIGFYKEQDIEPLKKLSENIVFIDYSIYDHIYDSVKPNYKLGLTEALDYLTGLGHAKIGYLTKTPIEKHIHSFVDKRGEIIQKYLEEKDIFEPEYFIRKEDTGNYAKLGYDTGLELIRENKLPTALITHNDTMAIGVIRALHEAGISVPDQISIIGINDLPTSKYIFPSLSTIRTPFGDMAKCAINLLTERIDCSSKYTRKLLIQTKFIARNSSGPLNS